MPDIAVDLDSNVIWIGEAGFEADYDKIIVLQDDPRSGYECATCLDGAKHTVTGKEVSTVSCPECAGLGTRPKVGNPKLTVKCSECDGGGWVVCPDCGGRGGTIVLAENTKTRPTTGTVVSIGPDVPRRKRGDKCIYPSFSGHAYDLQALDKKGKVVKLVLVVLSDSDVLCRMYGTLEQNTVKRSTALYTNS